MSGDLKFSAIVAALAGLPLFFLFGALWNPHGSIGSLALHYLGLFGIAPFLYVAEFFGYQQRLTGVFFACLAQYVWFIFLVFLLRRLWKTMPWRQNAL